MNNVPALPRIFHSSLAPALQRPAAPLPARFFSETTHKQSQHY
jgi:hypothetical protein